MGRVSADAGDGGPAVAAQLNGPVGFSLDSGGNLYFADSANNKVRVISKDGTIHTVAGNGVPGSGGDGGAATGAQLNNPTAVLVTPQGELLIAETGGNRVRKVLTDGTIQTLAGNGQRSSRRPADQSHHRRQIGIRRLQPRPDVGELHFETGDWAFPENSRDAGQHFRIGLTGAINVDRAPVRIN